MKSRIIKVSLTVAALGLGALTFAQSTETINLATGLDASGNLQTAGDLLDANWSINGGNTMKSGATAGQAFTVTSGDADWYGGWQSNGPNSSWIAQNPDSNNNGLLDATRTFNLTAGQLAGATFSNMGFSIDDTGYVLLNGVQVSPTEIYQNAGNLTMFSIDPSNLQAGTNTLEIKVTGTDDNLEAVRLEGTLTVNAAPEPSTWLLLVPALGSLVLLRKRS